MSLGCSIFEIFPIFEGKPAPTRMYAGFPSILQKNRVYIVDIFLSFNVWTNGFQS